MAMQELNQAEMTEIAGGATIAVSNTAGFLDGTVLNIAPAAIFNILGGIVGGLNQFLGGLLGGLGLNLFR
jgi:hypothetical protein